MRKDDFKSRQDHDNNVNETNQTSENKEGNQKENFCADNTKTNTEDNLTEKETEQQEESAQASTSEKEQSEVSKEELNKKIESLQQEKQQLQEQSDKHLNQLRRLQADFDNYKKRVAKEWDQKSAEKAKEMAEQLLPIMDNFERALNNADKEQVDSNFYDGIKMIYDQFNEVMQNTGLERIEAEGQKFDPNYHEAVMQVESKGYDSDVVVEELQPGFLFQGKLMRASVVKVSK